MLLKAAVFWEQSGLWIEFAPSWGGLMEQWLAENYFSSRIRIPGPFVQAFLNFYIEWYHRLGVISGTADGDETPDGLPIAAHSDDLMRMHYDLPSGLFEAFLGPSMKYSMGLWESGASNLEEAQAAMMEDLCRKAGIRDGDVILDVGCGFGSFAGYVLRNYPKATVYGLTLSKVQCDFIRDRQNDLSHPLSTDRFHLLQDDFNTVSFDRRFDRVVSIGLFEHISNLGKALEKVAGFIKQEGSCFLHYIVFRKPLNKMGRDSRQDNFFNRYIFPGGRVWFEDALFAHQKYLKIDRSWYLNGSNYRLTVESWLANFKRNLAQIRAKTGLDERQLKIWELYLRACIGMFHANRGNYYGNGQYLLTPK
jgi:cyclopropane-fatty-acyl-phospholipid synthase